MGALGAVAISSSSSSATEAQRTRLDLSEIADSAWSFSEDSFLVAVVSSIRISGASCAGFESEGGASCDVDSGRSKGSFFLGSSRLARLRSISSTEGSRPLNNSCLAASISSGDIESSFSLFSRSIDCFTSYLKSLLEVGCAFWLGVNRSLDVVGVCELSGSGRAACRF